MGCSFLYMTSSSVWMRKIPAVASNILLTHFGGFLLLTASLHGSLHRLYGRVPPWICRHWESLSGSLLAILFMKLIIFQIVQQVNSFLFNFFLEFGTPDRIRTCNLWCRRPLLIQLSFKRIKSLVVRAGLEPATTRLSVRCSPNWANEQLKSWSG